MSFTILPPIELAASLTYLGSKYYLSRQKKAGWLMGMTASVLTGIVFFSYDRIIITLQEVGNLLLYGYGYLHWKDGLTRLGNFRKTVLSFVVILSFLLSFLSLSDTGILEATANCLYVLGTVLIVYKSRWGWLGYMIVHAIVAYVSWHSGAVIFAAFQGISFLIASYSLLKQ